MRVLQVHNYYQLPGGEDAVVEREARILRDGGWEVELWAVDNAEISSPLSKIRVAWQSRYSRRARDAMTEKLRASKPDLVHVHNFFPLLTPSIYDACVQAGVPVVQTLHNYRTICPGGFLFRDGQVCVECVGGSAFHSVAHKCYRGSFLGTLAVARMVNAYQKTGVWHNKVDRFIALSEFAKSWFVAGGFPAERIAVKQNFTEDVGSADREKGARRGALFIGRLSPEKGVETLLRAWRHADVPLRIAGDGPLRAQVEQSARGNIKFLGHLSRPDLLEELKKAEFLIVPSEWYEGPLTVMEAYACGVPVICSDIGAMQEMVEEGVTGRRFKAGDADHLASCVRWARDHPVDLALMGENARASYDKNFTPEVNFEILTSIYKDVLG